MGDYFQWSDKQSQGKHYVKILTEGKFLIEHMAFTWSNPLSSP